MSKQNIMLVLAACLLGVAAWLLYQQFTTPPDPYSVSGAIVFNDHAETNATATQEQLDLIFVDKAGQPWRLKDLQGEKPVVLVMTRGYHLARCPYCTAQTSRLIRSYDEFTRRGAEVVVVYPGPLDHLGEFLDAVAEGAETAQVPFPMLYDQDLKAVDQLGIRSQLAKPSTFILDKSGNLRFAYIGQGIADRPSVSAMLKQLDLLGGE
jgi:peroxiredoxin